MKPEVCHTSSLFFGGDARGVPHPLPFPGYRMQHIDGPKNKSFCRDPKFIVNLAGETPAATARIIVNMLSV